MGLVSNSIVRIIDWCTQFHFIRILDNLATKLFFFTQFVLCTFPNLSNQTFEDWIFYLKVWYNLNRKLIIEWLRIKGWQLIMDWRMKIQEVLKYLGMVFCYQNCSDLLWEKIILVIAKNFWNLRFSLNFSANWKKCSCQHLEKYVPLICITDSCNTY